MQTMFERIKLLYKPEVFQGRNRKDRYFEGWYIKCVNQKGTETYAFIAGVSITKNGSHAFIQILDGARHTSEYFSFPLSDFHASQDEFHIRIADNVFSQKGIHLNLHSETVSIQGELTFSETLPWPVRILSPGIMGPFAFLPFLECYHGIVSLTHGISGVLSIHGKPVDFDAGRGYIEKDYGSSMPTKWIWMQTNNFKQEGVSLSVSIANVPLGKFSFRGFIIGFIYEGKLISFTTYNFSKIVSLAVRGDSVEIKIKNRKYILLVKGHKGLNAGLSSPVEGAMEGRINESLDSLIDVKLSLRANNKVLFSGTGTNAGIEVVNFS